MKKLAFYIPLGVAVGLGVVLAVSWWNRRNRAATALNQSGGSDYQIDQDSSVSKTFVGINYNLPLTDSTVDGKKEIMLLQRMINAYYGGTNSLVVTGKFDTPTRNAVKDITDKYSTSVYEFNYYYLMPKRGPEVLTNILQG